MTPSSAIEATSAATRPMPTGPPVGRLTVTVMGSGSVGGLGVPCDTGSTPCVVDFDYGTGVPLTPTAAPGQRFVKNRA